MTDGKIQRPIAEIVRLQKAIEQAAIHLEMAAATLDKAGRPAAAISARADAREARAILPKEPT